MQIGGTMLMKMIKKPSMKDWNNWIKENIYHDRGKIESKRKI